LSIIFHHDRNKNDDSDGQGQSGAGKKNVEG